MTFEYNNTVYHVVRTQLFLPLQNNASGTFQQETSSESNCNSYCQGQPSGSFEFEAL